jgi:hypothetical protein
MTRWRSGSMTQRVIRGALEKLGGAAQEIAAVGITNQRETTVVWNRKTGKPYYNAIVWQDTRTDRLCAELGGSDGPDRFRARVGLPLSTYFSGPKIRWLLDNVPGLREDATARRRPLRQHRRLADLESDRRHRRRRTHHRRHQRLSHHADGARRHTVGR